MASPSSRPRPSRPQIHAHMLVQGTRLRNATGKDVLGQIDVVGPRKRFGQPKGTLKSAKLACYLTKYLDKCFDMHEHSSKRYWSSKGAPKPEITQHWLGSQNITEMIKYTFDIAMLHGMEDFPAQIMQSRDRTLLWLSGARDLKLSFDQQFDI